MIKFDESFVRTFVRNTKAKTPILFFHTHDPNGRIEWQGYIYKLRKDGSGEAQLFDWFMGEESQKIDFTRAFLSECSFYSSDYEMKCAYRASERTFTKLAAV